MSVTMVCTVNIRKMYTYLFFGNLEPYDCIVVWWICHLFLLTSNTERKGLLNGLPPALCCCVSGVVHCLNGWVHDSVCLLACASHQSFHQLHYWRGGGGDQWCHCFGGGGGGGGGEGCVVYNIYSIGMVCQHCVKKKLPHMLRGG